MTLVEVVVALALAGLTVGGLVSGYIYSTNATAKDALYMAANVQASQRMEEVRAARWDPGSFPPVNQLTATNFPNEVVNLNTSGSDPTVVPATIVTSISQISTNPPLMLIEVDCVWNYEGTQVITNTIETCRAPD
jgi:type II secretory pathway pseudopilin PulG